MTGTYDTAHSMASTGGFAESHFASHHGSTTATVNGHGEATPFWVSHLHGSALGTSPERPKHDPAWYMIHTTHTSCNGFQLPHWKKKIRVNTARSPEARERKQKILKETWKNLQEVGHSRSRP